MTEDEGGGGTELQRRYTQSALAAGRGEVACADAGDRFGATCYGDLSASALPDGATRASLACGNPLVVVLGKHRGVWRDVILLERRSPRIM